MANYTKFLTGPWIELGQTGLIINTAIPPRLKGNDANNTLVWILAFAPIISSIINYLIANATYTDISSIWLWVIPVIINCILCIADERQLKKAGYSPKELLLWAFFLVPVYLFRRAYLLKQKMSYAIVWCITFVVSLFL